MRYLFLQRRTRRSRQRVKQHHQHPITHPILSVSPPDRLPVVITRDRVRLKPEPRTTFTTWEPVSVVVWTKGHGGSHAMWPGECPCAASVRRKCWTGMYIRTYAKGHGYKQPVQGSQWMRETRRENYKWVWVDLSTATLIGVNWHTWTHLFTERSS